MFDLLGDRFKSSSLVNSLTIVSQISSLSAFFLTGTLIALVKLYYKIQVIVGKREYSSTCWLVGLGSLRCVKCTGGRREGFLVKTMVY